MALRDQLFLGRVREIQKHESFLLRERHGRREGRWPVRERHALGVVIHVSNDRAGALGVRAGSASDWKRDRNIGFLWRRFRLPRLDRRKMRRLRRPQEGENKNQGRQRGCRSQEPRLHPKPTLRLSYLTEICQNSLFQTRPRLNGRIRGQQRIEQGFQLHIWELHIPGLFFGITITHGSSPPVARRPSLSIGGGLATSECVRSFRGCPESRRSPPNSARAQSI